MTGGKGLGNGLEQTHTFICARQDQLALGVPAGFLFWDILPQALDFMSIWRPVIEYVCGIPCFSDHTICSKFGRQPLREANKAISAFRRRDGINRYSLVAYSQRLAPELRTDRVIAEAWDTTYVLYDGTPDAHEIERLRQNVPKQEAGRYTERELILSRANKSVRLFEAVAKTLAAGHQPDPAEIESVGYLMRTTAVYGNGKFGLADRRSEER